MMGFLRAIDRRNAAIRDAPKLRKEVKRLRAVILDIARIVENPDDRALQRVRDVTDKHSSPIAPGEAND